MSQEQEKKPGLADRVLGLFSKVEPNEVGTVLLMTVNIFLVLLAYYIIKVTREPLIQTIQPKPIELFGSTMTIPGGAELKSYGAAGQAIVLMGFVPFYSWFSSRVDRMKLIIGVTSFFLVNIGLFALAVVAEVPYIGFIFFIWVGIFSLSVIAQFWSYANDIYTKEQGDRLFPIIGIGMTAGPPVGSFFAKVLFDAEIHTSVIMLIAAGVLGLHLGMSIFINRRLDRSADSSESKPAQSDKLEGPGGFTLIFKSKYLMLIAALLLLLNVVNTTGEFILGQGVGEIAKTMDNPGAYFGSFYGGFYSTVNVIALLIQAFVVSRIVKFTGITGILFALPLVSLGAYGLSAIGVGFMVFQWAKTAENSTDYSVMNTAKGMLWLPTSREEKYKGKQAIDTFVVRAGDVVSAGVVALGLNVFSFTSRHFAVVNIVVIALWMLVAFALAKQNRALAEES